MSVIEYAARELSARESIASGFVDAIRNKHNTGWEADEITSYLHAHFGGDLITKDFVQQVINRL